MKNIFLFIRRFSNFLLFVLLQAVALWFLFTYNKFHRARGLGVANEATGWFNARYNTMEDFFRMNEENKRLLRMNDSLMNLLPGNFVPIDTQSMLKKDSIPYDTLGNYRHWVWREAQALYSTVSSPNNYVQINRGSRHGIRDNMGVFSSDGALVGKVVNVGPNFSQVMSLIHRLNRVGVLVQRTGSAGTLLWDGVDPRYLQVHNIPRNDSVRIGDTIITGSLSLSYPAGHLVGRVEAVSRDNSTNFVTLSVRAAVNFAKLQQVMVVENLFYDEQNKLNRETAAKVEERK